ncbi:ribosome assembly protein 4 [Diplogelasinospora grovesii]|uniref:Ribosome assembly protein 4 n=1 Tax=Diplogelasinospora grovesii TaxID=303347 RepID=A0AAN6MYF9_9PEZI|nr:ribosome assembly protein 4 [Diplogelasinospora grovesii]
MPVPVALATLAATGSIVTSIKSGWELRRMIKRKTEEKEAEEEAPYVFRKLVRAYQAGLLSDAEYDIWYEKFLVAKVERDLSGLHRIRAHLRILYQGAPGGDRRPSTRHGSGSSPSSRHGSASSSSSSSSRSSALRAAMTTRSVDIGMQRRPRPRRHIYARGGSSKGSASDVSPKSRSKSVRYDDERSSRSRSRRHKRSDGDDDTDDAYRHRGRILPPPSKRQKREEIERSQVQQDVTALLPSDLGSCKVRFIDGDGNQMTDVIEIPLADASEKNVSVLLNTLLGRDREDFTPYRFRIHIPGKDIIIDQYPADLLGLLQKNGVSDPFETTITLSAEPQAVFKVQAVSRMAHRIPGHGQPILCAQFSPASSSRLATGSGDNTARLWDTDTGTPKHTLKGHTGWVLGVSWSPDGERLATCSMDKTVRIWDPETGKAIGQDFKGHAKWVLAVAWEPYHLWREGTARLASASKDGTVRIWVVNTGRTEHVLSGHKGSVACVKWGGTGLIYTGSHDKSVRVWDAVKGTLVHNMTSHAHWINHLALSTDFVLRTGFFDHTKDVPPTEEGKRAKALERFEKAAKINGAVAERCVSASDDFTMYLWDPTNNGNKPVARLLGHQNKVNQVQFSPDGTLIASAGWDNGTKIWNARDGKFLKSLRGHVYQCAWSADSRLLATGSKDCTLKVWNVRNGNLAMDLPGHEDEVYAVDWAADGKMVGSGGKDRAVRLWRN